MNRSTVTLCIGNIIRLSILFDIFSDKKLLKAELWFLHTELHAVYYCIRPNYRSALSFSKLLGTLICGKICIYLLRIHYKKDQKKDLFDDDYVIVSDFLYKGICCGHSFELHRQVDTIQMSTNNICF